MSLQQDQQKQFLKDITMKALTDSAYKERLIANPDEAIRELYPQFDAGDTKIVVQDQTTPKTMYLNISRTMAGLFLEGTEEMELSEEELEMVSGGGITINIFCRPKNDSVEAD